MDEGPPVRGGGADGLEVGDSLWEELPVETEDNAAEGLRVGAGGEVEAERAIRGEVARAEAEVHEDAVGDDAGLRLGG